VVNIRQVISFAEDQRVPSQIGEEVELHFGMKITENKVSIYSAEEERGNICYSLVVGISGYDIEIIDVD
jgi:hypothetical protein